MKARRSRILPGLLVLALLCPAAGRAADPVRHDTLLAEGWRTAEDDVNPERYAGFAEAGFDDRSWITVEVPHNWEGYTADHGLVHGDRHGTAWYRRSVAIPAGEHGRRFFLYFEGVGAYATVWVNGRLVGRHAGGRTTFTLDITGAVTPGRAALVVVRADYPDGIRDLPWVAGGDAPVYGFSEGTQPMGIFRPVHLVVTDEIRVEPFGVHCWNGEDISAAAAVLHVETEVRNYGSAPRDVALRSRLRDRAGRVVAEMLSHAALAPGQTATLRQDTPALAQPHLWSLDDPYLYTLESTVLSGPRELDRVETTCGLRTIHWPATATDDPRFLLNGRPVFLNGVAEYEHLLGDSHAFTAEQIRARVGQIRAAGFNAFRDAHQPHNLRYQEYWDREGLAWWPQFAAHIWFDTPAFRANFKALLRDWVRERRNSPSLVLWGLENESILPPDFARECSDLIRELDPTASSQRKITTCNGGTGTDWNVPQNWSGTYGGDPAKYADELKRQKLVGEYGAWRSIDLHTEGPFRQDGVQSEDRMTALLEGKIRLAESVRGQACGQFLWLFSTHENPGRKLGWLGEQHGDGIRPIDQVAPANNKGLLTLWGEPTDAYYLYRSNYAPAATQPMVYIVSHTWPDRWTEPGRKSGIIVYSNCDEVELFNDYRGRSLGRRTRGGKGTHFQWDDVEIGTNVLYAEGYRGGRRVATDSLILDRLPPAPHRAELDGDVANLTAPAPGQNYLYRVNCGGPDYRDSNGNLWSADRDDAPGLAWGSQSWAAAFPNVPPDLGSQREVHDPIVGTRDDALFQTFRYGREELRYRFAVPDGKYRIELYLIEPWYGRGGGLDCTGWRLFDVALNGDTVLHDVDLWKEAGYCHAVKKVVEGTARGGVLVLSFPRVASYQAVISAIALSTANRSSRAPADRPAARPAARTTAAAIGGRPGRTGRRVFRRPGSARARLARPVDPRLPWRGLRRLRGLQGRRGGLDRHAGNRRCP